MVVFRLMKGEWIGQAGFILSGGSCVGVAWLGVIRVLD